MAVVALDSVHQILEKTLQHQHLILHNKQEIESLLQQVSFLQHELNTASYSSSGKSSEFIEFLEGQIVNAAYKARDVIRSHIMEQLLRESSHIFTSYNLFHRVQSDVIFIDKEVRKFQEENGVEDLWPRIHSSNLDCHLLKGDIRIYSRLRSPPLAKVRTISVHGTAGIGKTTLAKTVYNASMEPCNGFEVCAWATVSQNFFVRQIIIDLLGSIKMFIDHIHEESTEKLSEYLYNGLKHRTYLIVLDDVWDTKVWDDLIPLLPNDYNGSRILLTTRLEEVAVYTDSSSSPIRMSFFHHIHHREGVAVKIREQAVNLLSEVSSLQYFLETYSRKGCEKIKSLENQITKAAKELRSLTGSNIVFYNIMFSAQCLMEVKGELDFIKQLVMKVEEAESSAQDLRPRTCLPATAGSSKPVVPGLVGLHEDFTEIKNQLAAESQRLEVISLVGMGGIGKTTLAREVYKDKFILEFFLVRAWVTASQSYDMKKSITSLLDSMEKSPDHETCSIEDLEERLYKSLKGRRYMIVIDDVWETKVWDDLRRLFPDDKNSSRILLTTRLENVAVYAKSSCLHHMRFLDEHASWKLFCNKVFGEDHCCFLELDEIGKKIVQSCQGLPLAIIVIGGLFSKGSNTLEYWRNIAENLSSGIISNNDYSSKILSLSYSHLPQHLKECFLYTGIFPEDFSIPVSKLIKLWIAEGLLEPMESNSLEDQAYEYLFDLIDRSLLLVDEWSSIGRIKICKIHDIVRDFCTRKAKKEMLSHISDGSLGSISVGANMGLLSIHPNTVNIFPYDEKKLSSLQVSSFLNFDPQFGYLVGAMDPKPLRVLDVGGHQRLNRPLNLGEFLSHNLRYFVSPKFLYMFGVKSLSTVCSTLQTLILDGARIEIPIWSLPQLRHVKADLLHVSDPSEGETSALVLENLQTLSQVYNFKWSMEAIQRIPNLKKLCIIYDGMASELQRCLLDNLAYLHKLEALTCQLPNGVPSFLHIITFPPSLKKLTLHDCRLPWKDMVIVGNSLPNLEALKLKRHAFEGREWESTEEQFPKLKYLLLEELYLEQWEADSDHFPRLQRLIIRKCIFLKEIPYCIGEIPTLQMIELHGCSNSLIASVKAIQQEQQDLGNDTLQVHIQGVYTTARPFLVKGSLQRTQLQDTDE